MKSITTSVRRDHASFASLQAIETCTGRYALLRTPIPRLSHWFETNPIGPPHDPNVEALLRATRLKRRDAREQVSVLPHFVRRAESRGPRTPRREVHPPDHVEELDSRAIRLKLM